MSEAFVGQVVLVVGGTKGIGAAIADDLAAHGASVVIAGRDVEAGEARVEDIIAAGGEAVMIQCDVTSSSDCDALGNSITDRFGRLDTVFANQGVSGPARPLIEWSDEAVARCLDVNLLGCLSLARASHSLLAAEGGGRFIVTGSGTGHGNTRGMGMYGISKAAASYLVRQLALEWRPQSIAVNELVPGPVRTEMTGFQPNEPADADPKPFEAFVKRTGEWLKDPADVASLAHYLAGLPTDGPSGQVFSMSGRLPG